jgi:AraC-like DNA-binding protein
VSYKPLLIRMRVARARRLLASDPHAPITGVADAVGFGDLSHFERTFKRLVGCTPRDYRRRHLPRQIVDFADSSVASAAKTVASS